MTSTVTSTGPTSTATYVQVSKVIQHKVYQRGHDGKYPNDGT